MSIEPKKIQTPQSSQSLILTLMAMTVQTPLPVQKTHNLNEQDFFEGLLKQLDALLKDPQELPLISHLSNTVALIYHSLPDLNWVGFYLLKPTPSESRTLYLGPFQGKIACTQIPFGKGVCGESLKLKKLMNVPNVHEFQGHIACDSASNSEVVVPLTSKEGDIFGVLDVDSPVFSRFGNLEIRFLQAVVDKLMNALDFTQGLL
jgi:GAF domain-containing protein